MPTGFNKILLINVWREIYIQNGSSWDFSQNWINVSGEFSRTGDGQTKYYNYVLWLCHSSMSSHIEIGGSHPVICKFLFTTNCIGKTKTTKKTSIFKQNILIQSIHDQKRSLVERLKRRNIIYCFQGSW